jgi:endoglycosylceramidase
VRRSAAGALAAAALLVATAAGGLGGAPAAGSAPGAAAAGAPQVEHRLRATLGVGARVVDDLGRTVLLRGVNLNGLGEYYQEHPDLPATLPLTEADLAGIAAHGFDVVRLLLSWSRIEPEPGRIDTGYLDRIAEVVGWARAHDVYVLLDLHQDAWGPAVATPDGVDCPPPLQPAIGWDGAPAWATALAGTAATCTLGQRELSVAAQASFTALFADVLGTGLQGHLAGSWAAVAERFAADPAVAGYDLLNEPNPGLVPGVDDYVLLGALYQRLLGAIRGAEAGSPGGFDHIGFFEPSVLTGPLSLPGPLPGLVADGNVVYAPHLYNESISILPGTIEEGFQAAATAAASYGTTFFSGEWGWFGDPATDQPRLERYAAAEDAHLVGGTWWQWAQACGDPHAVPARHQRPPCEGRSPYSDGLVTRPAANVEVLTRAYPRAVPGVLRRVDADVRAGGLVVAGEADRAGVEADLWVPARCRSPRVAGDGLGPAVARSVDGGWRVAVPVARTGPYRIEVRCGGTGSAAPASTPAPVPDSSAAGALPALPSTGGGAEGARAAAALLALLAAAAAVRALSRSS